MSSGGGGGGQGAGWPGTPAGGLPVSENQPIPNGNGGGSVHSDPDNGSVNGDDLGNDAEVSCYV